MNLKKIVIIIVIIFLILTISRNINKYAVDFIENQKERENGLLVGAEPFTFSVNQDVTALLIHGTGSSPKDYIELANFLAENNVSSRAILLPGHGTYPRDLSKVSYEEWLEEINKELNNINSKNKFLIGYSLGGTLSLKTAESHDLSGVISINSPIFLQSRYIAFIPLLELVQKYHVSNPENIILATKEERVAYDAMPLNTILEIVKTVNNLDLEKVTESTLIIQTKNDEIVDPKSADFIYESISSRNKKIEWLELSSHVKPHEEEQRIMFEEILLFIQENSKP